MKSARLLLSFLGLLGLNLSAYGSFTILSDIGDGSVGVIQGGGTFATNQFQDERVGLNGDEPTRTRLSAIYFFELPDMTGQTMTGAEFSFPLENISSSPDFNLDLWGLGYVSTPTLDAAWYNGTQSDSAAGLGISSRVLIENNLLTASSFDPEGSPIFATNSSSSETALMGFLSGLRDNGAVAGDFAVLRLSADDEPNFGVGTPGYVVGFREFDGLDPQLEVTTVPEPSVALSLMVAMPVFVLVWLRRRRSA